MFSVRRVTGGLFRKRIVLALLLAAALVYVLMEAPQRTLFLQLPHPLDIVAHRNTIGDPIAKVLKVPTCQSYFDALAADNHYVPLTPNDANNFEFDSQIYKEKKWRRERALLLKRGTRKSEVDYARTREEQARFEYYRDCHKMARYETRLVRDFAHTKVFGKCFLETDTESLHCSRFEKELYSWMSRESPLFLTFLGPKPSPFNDLPCFVQGLKQKSSGRGIVVPILPSARMDRQIEGIKRLIKVLRASKNTLPIEITYMNKTINQHHIQKLARAAIEVPSNKVRRFYNNTPWDQDLLFPKQSVTFVDLEPTLNTNTFRALDLSDLFQTANLYYSLSTIFNSFAEFVIMSPHAIPLTSDLETRYFQNEAYQESGVLMFKLPSKLSYKMRRFPPGFHEISNLILDYMMPTAEEHRHYGLNQRSHEHSLATNRVFQQYFHRFVDPSVMVFNKAKVLNGLLMAVSFQMHKVFNARFDFHKDELAPEALWIGQELAGTNAKVPFNRNFGVAPGIITPKGKAEYNMMAQELCSASWGQISDADDFTLLYVTSHQLENWRNDGGRFHKDLEAKYSVVNTQGDFVSEDGEATGLAAEGPLDKLVFDKIASNPLYLEAILRPPVLEKKIYIQDSDEPVDAWNEEDEFGSGSRAHPYWCGYDNVGHHETGERGVIISLNDNLQVQYKFLLDVWFENGP